MTVPYAKPKPRGMLRLLLRLPPLLYRRGLARRMGPRFLLPTTTGRRTGLARTVGLNYARDGHTVYVISAFGRTDWYRNLVAHPVVEVQVGTERWRGLARPVSDSIERERAGELFSDQAAVGQGPPPAVRSVLRRLGLDYEAKVCRVRDPGLELPIVAIERSSSCRGYAAD